MPKLRNNILANYAGQAWMALMAVAFVPAYTRVLGMEAFGLVGLMLSLQAISMLLDVGMGGVLNRELARRSQFPGESQSAANLARTLELIIWPIACVLATGLWATSGFIAEHWLHTTNMSTSYVAYAISVMGLAVASQWPSSFYTSGLSGLEQQPILNAINIIFATARGLGVLPILYFVSPTVTAFFWWNVLVGSLQSLVLAVAFWRKMLPSPAPARIDWSHLKNCWQFAGGLLAIMALSIALSQTDRIVLSKMRPLEELGYYSLALSAAAGLGRLIQPMFNALYPRYSRLVATGDRDKLLDLYHLSNQCLIAVVAATAAVLIFFAKEVLLFWTNSVAIVEKAAIPMTILVIGTSLNGMLNLPYALQLANGWTRLTVTSNAIALLLGVPFCIWATGSFGMAGAATLWLLVNLGNFLVIPALTHRRLLPEASYAWYSRDVLPAMAIATVSASLCHWAMGPMQRTFGDLALLALASLITLAITTLSLGRTRQLLRSLMP